MRPRANWPVCPPEPTAAPPITSPAPSPTPPCRGLALYGPPTKAPGPWPPREGGPLRPPLPPQAVRRTGESVKSPYPPPRRGGLFTDPPGGGACSEAPPPPLLKRKVPPPCVHPGPRASRAGFASPPLHLPSTPPAGAANSPRRANWRPTPPFPGPRSTAGRPSPGAGGGDRRWRMVTWGPACRGGRTARVTLPGPPPPTTPDNDDAISPTPSRGPLHRPPSPGGRGLALQCLLSKTPPPHLPGKAAPSTPAPEPPAKPSSELANHQRSPYLSPNPRGGGALHRPYWQRGHALHYPPSNAPPPGRPGRLAPSTPPASTPGQAVERTGQSLKAPYLSPEPGASPTTPLPEGPGSLVPTIRSPGVRSIGTVRPPRRKVRPS
ncbi:hypothetical protein N7530_012979 [Penicillium desertorum]|uniref:Uncharacterized protein n=1 Tax=Penicillium desertorum TaxID=1303715 RepID=A0A9W9WCV4_9EURO|nr:hypothetical protein N7530_012979 [Penicillium desertorum]